MGNCMHSPPKEKITSGPYNGFKLLHHAQPYLPLPPNAKLKSGEVYYLVPKVAQPRSPQLAHKLISDNSSRGQECEDCGDKATVGVAVEKCKEVPV
ncbi:hypothetical protein L1049_009968 [Liquidambar formosana]|uniref:Uncharacterized protein n=1 Tax=Liquidambar formosana TaxID=63359 RepID=A0AAP0R3X2_LIQFO